MPASRPLEERFWEKVNKHGRLMPHMKTCCWEWAASKDGNGYGLIGLGPGKPLGKANRVSWELRHKRKIPRGKCALHHCDNSSCVRLSHLYLGTQKQNAADRERRGRMHHATGAAHGSHTHPESLRRGDDHWTRQAHPWAGSSNCKAVLTPTLVLRIRAAFNPATMEYVDLAGKYNVSPSTIGNIIRRETWANI